MREGTRRLLMAVVLLASSAAPMLGQGNPTGRISGTVTAQGQGLPGVLVTASSSQPPRHARDVHRRQRRLSIVGAAARHLLAVVLARRLHTTVGRGRGVGGAGQDLRHGARDLRGRGRDRGHGQRRDDLRGRNRLHHVRLRGSGRQARHQPRPRGRAGARSRHQLHRPGAQRRHRRGLHLGQPVVREPVHGQRRGGQREPARPGARSLHRGRHPGDHRLGLGHLRRVRPLHRRRGEHHHQVRRQRDPRLAAHQLRERELGGGDSGHRRSGRLDAGHLGRHRGRSHRQGSALVLPGRPHHRSRSRRADLRLRRAVRPGAQPGPPRSQAHHHLRAGSRAAAVLHRHRGRREQQQPVRPGARACRPVRPRGSPDPAGGQLQRRDHRSLPDRSAVLGARVDGGEGRRRHRVRSPHWHHHDRHPEQWSDLPHPLLLRRVQRGPAQQRGLARQGVLLRQHRQGWLARPGARLRLLQRHRGRGEPPVADRLSDLERHHPLRGRSGLPGDHAGEHPDLVVPDLRERPRHRLQDQLGVHQRSLGAQRQVELQRRRSLRRERLHELGGSDRRRRRQAEPSPGGQLRPQGRRQLGLQRQLRPLRLVDQQFDRQRHLDRGNARAVHLALWRRRLHQRLAGSAVGHLGAGDRRRVRLVRQHRRNR